MGLLDDAAKSLDASAEAQRLGQQRAQEHLAREEAAGAELAADFIARARAAGIDPDTDLHERRLRERRLYTWRISGGRAAVGYVPALMPGSQRTTCLRDEVVGQAWSVQPFRNAEPLLLSTDGLVASYASDVTALTTYVGLTRPDPLPEWFKRWREHPVLTPLRGSQTIGWYNYGEGQEMPVAAAMVQYLRQRSG